MSRRRGSVPLAVNGADSGQPKLVSSSTSAVVSSTLYCGAGMPPFDVAAAVAPLAVALFVALLVVVVVAVVDAVDEQELVLLAVLEFVFVLLPFAAFATAAAAAAAFSDFAVASDCAARAYAKQVRPS